MSKVDCREAIRLNAAGLSRRAIANSMGCTRKPVSNILNRAKKKNLTWDTAERMSGKEVEMILFPERSRRGEQAEPDFEYVHQELGKRGVTLTLLHTEYCEKCEAEGLQPYGYTQFRVKYRDFAQQKKATMRILHKPAEAMEVDWAGDKLFFGNAEAGTLRKCSLFVAALPCSQMMYAEAFLDEKSENWITANVHALEYFGGVPEMIVPDNLKTGITKHTRSELIVASAYRDMAAYYDTVIMPTRVATPKDKPSVEWSVGFCERWVIARLRNERFLSLVDLNQRIRELMTQYNDMPFQKKEGSRRSVFEAEEREFLKPLPELSYEVPIWKTVKIQPDYLIEAEGCKYSVPYQFIGCRCQVRVKRETVDVFCDSALIASHKRRPPQTEPVYNLDHMPENHRQVFQYTEESCREWANSAGGSIATVALSFLDQKGPSRLKIQGCRALMQLADKYSLARLEKACALALTAGPNPGTGVIETLLRNNRETGSFEPPQTPNKSQGLSRGPEYFRRQR